MQVFFIEDLLINGKVKRGAKLITLTSEAVKGDILVIGDSYFEIERIIKARRIARMCDYFENVSTAEIKLLRELLCSYREITYFNDFIKENEIESDKTKNLISESILRVLEHGKISEKEAEFLFLLFTGNKNKKTLLKEKVCTYEELVEAYHKFSREYEFCYGFKNKYVDARIASFSKGELTFLYDFEVFEKTFGIGKDTLLGILKKLSNCSALSDENEFSSLVDKFMNEDLKNDEEKEKFINLCKRAIDFIKEKIEKIYTLAAEKLVKEDKISIDAINSYTMETRLSFSKLAEKIKKIVGRSFAKERKRSLQDFLDCSKNEIRPGIFIISGPSCSGKTTIFEEIVKQLPELKRTISDTTRAPRVNEIDGVDYNFVTKEYFEKQIEENGYIEFTKYDDNYYGTRRKCLENADKESIAMIIEVEGAKNIKREYKAAVTIFIMPPSIEELRRRIISRGSNTEEEIERRLKRAVEEIGESFNFDYTVVNYILEDAVKEVIQIIKGK